jgi:NAD(P)-dependent dehydrogenase (short-subunit alcohol dehydrogenase family)
VDLHDRKVLVLGGAGLVGLAVARRILEEEPRRLVVTSLRRREAEDAVAELESERGSREGTEITAAWGDIFVPAAMKDRGRAEVLADGAARADFVDDVYGELTDAVLERSTLGALLLDEQPDVIVDCINTAGAMAYQNAFGSAAELRAGADRGTLDAEAVERHLSTLYLPQLIRHVQISLEAMRRVGTDIYVKVGTAGTGGMGLNIPFTHSEERPSRVLLAKSGLAGAHTLLLYLMARTPGAPAVKEIKPTAAISWKSIAYGPVLRGGRALTRSDSTGPLPVFEAFGDDHGFVELDEPLEGVYLDAGENGLFSIGEFEALTALGLMEYVTPEEIAENVFWEIVSHPTGKDVVAALDAATMGPTYRAGVLRSVALERMEAMEENRGVRSVAYEMLGPPRLSKLLFEGEILARLHGTLEAAAALDPESTAERAQALIEEDGDFRQRILSIGLPILLADGERILRGALVKVPLEDEDRGIPGRVSDRGWVDLRPSNWTRWEDRCGTMMREIRDQPGPEHGSRGDHEFGDPKGPIRPGRLAAWVFRYEDKGERIKR